MKVDKSIYDIGLSILKEQEKTNNFAKEWVNSFLNQKARLPTIAKK